jgi:anti-sigma factor RsiW
MPACDQVKLLLGPFDDGELEPHEMEDVAFHVAGCTACKATLEDYRSLGVALRDCLPQPTVDGFTSAVLKRIDQLPQPLWKRWWRHANMLAEHAGGAMSLVAAGALAALITAWLVTPYTQRLLHRSSNLVQVASSNQNDSTGLSGQALGASQNALLDQSQPPMITLTDDPSTTVIWLPNQP